MQGTLLRVCAGVMLATAGVGVLAAGAVDSAKLAGAWKLEQSAGIEYFEFAPQHTCSQVGKASILGFTKWVAVACRWSLDRDSLTLTITAPASDSGTVQKVTVSELSAQTLTITDGSHAQSFTRVPEVPADFVAKLPKSAPPKQP